MRHPDAHAWVGKRMAAYAAGLLDGTGDATLFREHLDACEVCRESFETFIDEEGSEEKPDGHIPATLLVHWERTVREVEGLERALMREHLESCPVCRLDLEFLGFVPELVPDPDREVELPEAPVATEGAPVLAGAVRGETSPDRLASLLRERRIRWLLATWAGAATVAALALLFIRPAPRDSSPPVTGFAAPTLILSSERGEGANVLDVGERTRAIVFGLPAMQRFPRESEVIIEALDGSGRTIASDRYRAEDLLSRSGLVLTSREPWAPGTYRLRIASAVAASDSEGYAFELRARSPRP